MSGYVWKGPASGSWDTASNWLVGGAPATRPPGSADGVSVAGADGSLLTLTGAGEAVSLTLSGAILFSGDFTAGALTYVEDGGVVISDGGEQPVFPGVYVGAGDVLTILGDAGPPPPQNGGTGVTLANGSVGGNVFFDIDGPNASLFVGRTLTLANLTVTNGAKATVGALAMGTVSVDATSSFEVGDAGLASPGSITVDSGAAITEGGTLSAAAVVDNGMIETAFRSSFTISAPVSGSGVLEIAGDSGMSVEQVSEGVTVRFGPPTIFGSVQGLYPVGGSLSLSAASLDASGALGAAIVGFAPGDVIDFGGTVTSATWHADLLTLSDGSSTVARLHLLGDYAASSFTMTADGGSTQIGISGEWLRAGHDFAGEGTSDILIENTAGAIVVGDVQHGAVAYDTVAGLGPEWTFHGVGDFLGDGKSDFLIENAAGAVIVGEVGSAGAAYTQVAALGPEWKFVGSGDFLGDGHDQFLIENGAVLDVGEWAGGAIGFTRIANLGQGQTFVGAGDFLGEGNAQFLIETDAGAVDVGDWTGGAIHFTQVAALGPEWRFVGAGDLLSEGHAQFLVENGAGAVDAGDWTGGAIHFTQVAALGPEWRFVGVGDYLGEGHDQFLIENASGAVVVADWSGGAIHYAQVAALGSEWSFH